ncbi:hypothetical protein M5K25_027244 [Dendrobium thyrsiflorum]|uniref:DUF674 family protein n=1 Tax=Dendrobium thyrsiflorum TaxID=117978 RepID=A0ABD0TZJ6_DENTH
MSNISVRLLVDKEKKRVVFAEAGNDFIDVLFSFLTLPLGSIVRLLGKQSGLGSLNRLYESIEQLDAKYLQTEACKEMLLKPRSAAAKICEDLKIKNIHEDNPRDFYICKESDCLIQFSCYYTYVTKARCSHCGKLMDKALSRSKGTVEKKGVFVNDGADFIITDDLRVMPISLMSGFSLLKELRIKDAGMLEERVIDVGNDEALKLLRISLVSNRALTRLFFPDECMEQSVKCFSMFNDEIKKEIVDGEDEKQMNVKIIFNKKNSNVLYAEVEGDFVNQLLSFLTFPLGSMFVLLGDQISFKGSISNLYFSAKILNLECFESEKCKTMLVLPEISSFYGCSDQMLQLHEMTSTNVTFSSGCVKCFLDYGSKSPPPCKHGLREAKLIMQNPKLKNGGSDFGGGFVEDKRRFMVADNLQISPISSISAVTKGIDFLIPGLVEREVSVDKAKVLLLLGATLISKTVLTDVFSAKPMYRKRRKWLHRTQCGKKGKGCNRLYKKNYLVRVSETDERKEPREGVSCCGFHRRAAVVEELQVVVGALLLLLITDKRSGFPFVKAGGLKDGLQHKSSSQHAMSNISVRLLVDKEQKRVVFAEAGNDFIDVLFSFLTLPLGSIVRLLGKQSGLGSLNRLYESVEQLDVKHLQTEACKEMLLNPRSAAAKICEDLKIKNIHDDNPRGFYICKETDCLIQSSCYYTYVTKGRCSRCGKLMNKDWSWSKRAEEKRGVFVNDRADFIITDDLRVMPISLISGFSLLEELRIKDAGILEERVIDVGNDEALKLLRISLVSKRALTRLFFPDECIEQSVKCFSMIKEEIKEEIDDGEEEEQMNVKIIFNKKNNNVLYAEVEGDFVNQLLSFLTFPLGSVFMLLGDQISLEGCISNLYSSAERLNLECFESEKRKNMLVLPEIASYYGCSDQMLQLDEMISTKGTLSSSCVKCHLDNGSKSSLTPPCKHGLREIEIIQQNPKLENGGSDSGGGFVEDERRFMVTDNLQISPISSISAITKGIDFLISDLVEKEVSVDKAKVLSLLGGTLISKTVLTNVFYAKPMYRKSY